MRSKYQWPASRLGEEEMALLHQRREQAKQSICELLRRAVHISYGEAAKEKEDQNDCKTKDEETKVRSKKSLS